MDVGIADKAGAQTTEILSLQARIEQCEAAISTARGTVGRIESPVETDAKAEAVAGGAMAAIDRCNDLMADLNERLTVIADKIGLI